MCAHTCSSKAHTRSLCAKSSRSTNPSTTCIRQHTSAYVSIRQYTKSSLSTNPSTTFIRQHPSASVSIREYTSVYEVLALYKPVYYLHTSAYVSIRQYVVQRLLPICLALMCRIRPRRMCVLPPPEMRLPLSCAPQAAPLPLKKKT